MFEQELHAIVRDATELPIENVSFFINETGVAYPAALIHIASTKSQRTFQGSISLQETFARIEVWADTRTECIRLKNLLSSIDDYQGSNDASIRHIELEESYPASHPFENRSVFSYSLDFRIFHY